MEKIILEPTATTPKIIFSPEEGYFEISGKSLPENSFEFYKPLLDFMDAYSEKPNNETHLIFKLEYFNTSSTSHFLRLIKKLEKIYTEGNNALVKWFYDTEDDDMKEAGEDFKMLAKLPIEIISTNMDE
jgi:hypothetical protein